MVFDENKLYVNQSENVEKQRLFMLYFDQFVSDLKSDKVNINLVNEA